MTNRTDACLYIGRVTHQRHAPNPHKLSYRIFSLLLDPEALNDSAPSRRLFSRNAFNLFSFHDRDHGDGSATPLRIQVDRLLAAAGTSIDGGHIEILCMPRVLGYAFNPLSVFYCYDAQHRLAALVYEVNNTFGQRHTYVIPVRKPDNADGIEPKIVEQSCVKKFHVSPFMDMNMHYRFRVSRPGTHLSLTINVGQLRPGVTVPTSAPTGATEPAPDASQPMLDAVYGARQATLDDATLARLFFSHPLLTLKVVAGIHWEALQIWLKGTGYRPCPPAGAPLTIVGVDGRLREPPTTSCMPYSSTRSHSKVS